MKKVPVGNYVSKVCVVCAGTFFVSGSVSSTKRISPFARPRNTITCSSKCSKAKFRKEDL